MVKSVLVAVREAQLERLDIQLMTIPYYIDAALSRAVTRAKVCNIYDGKARQLEAILRGVSVVPSLILKTLNLRAQSWSFQKTDKVSPDVMARAAVKLNSLSTQFSSEAQFEEIITIIASSEDNKLRKLNCGGPIDSSQLSPETVAKALVKLETTGNIIQYDSHDSEFGMTPNQVTHLFNNIKDTEELRLTELLINHVDVSHVASDVLAEAVLRLESVKIRVKPAQIQSLVTRLHHGGGSRLKKLHLEFVDLSAVTTSNLIGAIRMVECVEFHIATFTLEQVTAIGGMVSEGSQGMLERLAIYYSGWEDDDMIDLLQDVAAEPNDILDIKDIYKK